MNAFLSRLFLLLLVLSGVCVAFTFQTHVVGNVSHSFNGSGWIWLTQQITAVL